MLRLHTGIDAEVLHGFVQFLVAEIIQRAAGDGLGGVLDNAQLLGNSNGGVLMVAGDHHRADAGIAALHNSGLDFRTHRVDHAGQTDEAQLLLQHLRLDLLGQAVAPQSLRGSQHTQGLIGHGLIGGKDLAALFLGHGEDGALFLITGAALQHFVRRALGILNEAGIHLMDGGHHLAGGIKRRFRHAGLPFFQTVFGQLTGSAEVHQRGLRRLTLGCTGLVQIGVVAKCHSGGQQLGVAHVLHHGHLILRQRAGLIRTDDLRTAQRLHGGQAANHGVMMAHLGHTDGKHHCHNGGKALGNGGNRQRNRHHEGLENPRQ